MSKSFLEKAQRLAQSDATWLCAARRARFWITPKKQPPYRPFLLLVIDQATGRIRQAKVEDERPTPDVVLDVLLKGMLKPVLGSGRRARPASVVLDDAALVQELSPRLAEIGVRCEYRAALPMIDETAREFEPRRSKQAAVPSLLSVPGVTEPLMRELFAAAVEYYRHAPWRWLDNMQPIEVRYPSDGRTRYAVVLGSGREFFGLSFYDSVDDLRLVYDSNKPERMHERISWFSLVFEEPTLMTFDDLDAAEKYGWPLPEEHIYPVALKTTPTTPWTTPSASEIACLAAGLRVIPDFVIRHLRADRGLPRSAQATYSLPGVHGGQTVTLRYPVEGLSEYTELYEEDELEDFIEDWYWDEPSYKYARQLGAFLFQFLDDLEAQGLAEQTVRKHSSNCWAIGYLMCQYGPLTDFSPQVFLSEPSYLYEFRRKFSDSQYAVASYKATWRKLGRYVQSLG